MHLPWKELGYAFGGLALLLALYVGAYFGTVTAEELLYERRVTTSTPVEKQTTLSDGTVKTSTERQEVTENLPCRIVVASYSLEGTFGEGRLQSFFAPIHELDRSLRHHLWKGPGPDSACVRMNTRWREWVALPPELPVMEDPEIPEPVPAAPTK